MSGSERVKEHRVELARGDYFMKNLNPFAKKSTFADGGLLARGSDRVKGKAKPWLAAHRKVTKEMAEHAQELAEYAKNNPKAGVAQVAARHWPWVAGGVAAAGLGYAGHRALKGNIDRRSTNPLNTGLAARLPS